MSNEDKARLEYLPASKQQPKQRLENIEEKKKSGFLPEPGQKLPNTGNGNGGDMVNFYDEINQRQTKTWEKIYTNAKYNPFVPLGVLVTVGVLFNGLWAMKSKDRAKSQRMMRYRIAAQGSTVIALVVGTMASQYFYRPTD